MPSLPWKGPLQRRQHGHSVPFCMQRFDTMRAITWIGHQRIMRRTKVISTALKPSLTVKEPFQIHESFG